MLASHDWVATPISRSIQKLPVPVGASGSGAGVPGVGCPAGWGVVLIAICLQLAGASMLGDPREIESFSLRSLAFESVQRCVPASAAFTHPTNLGYACIGM